METNLFILGLIEGIFVTLIVLLFFVFDRTDE